MLWGYLLLLVLFIAFLRYVDLVIRISLSTVGSVFGQLGKRLWPLAVGSCAASSSRFGLPPYFSVAERDALAFFESPTHSPVRYPLFYAQQVKVKNRDFQWQSIQNEPKAEWSSSTGQVWSKRIQLVSSPFRCLSPRLPAVSCHRLLFTSDPVGLIFSLFK